MQAPVVVLFDPWPMVLGNDRPGLKSLANPGFSVIQKPTKWAIRPAAGGSAPLAISEINWRQWVHRLTDYQKVLNFKLPVNLDHSRWPIFLAGTPATML
jgi:hypothetical protein